MKLFRIIVLHGGPKSSHTSTEIYLAANSEDEVAGWIDKSHCNGFWFGTEWDDEPRVRYDYDIEKEISLRDFIIKNKGDIDDEEGWDDAYYGITKWGWTEIEGATEEDIARLIELKIAVKV